jgi:hypothetical protein
MAKWETALEQLRKDPTVWATLPSSMRKALRERGFANDVGQLIEIEPLQPDQWRIQTWVKVGDAETWADQISPIGEKMIYDTQLEAEKNARQLSLQNPRAFRVVQYHIDPVFIVYDYGQRYFEDGLTHIRTRIDAAVFEQEGDEATDLYRLESRAAYSTVPLTWEPPAPTDYLDLQSASDAALSLSKANPRREYRVVLGETGLTPEPVVYRGGDAFPDTDYLHILCNMVNPGDTAQALLSLLVLWKGEKAAHSLIREMFGKVAHE